MNVAWLPPDVRVHLGIIGLYFKCMGCMLLERKTKIKPTMEFFGIDAKRRSLVYRCTKCKRKNYTQTCGRVWDYFFVEPH
jgi:hypothetical protein